MLKQVMFRVWCFLDTSWTETRQWCVSWSPDSTLQSVPIWSGGPSKPNGGSRLDYFCVELDQQLSRQVELSEAVSTSFAGPFWWYNLCRVDILSPRRRWIPESWILPPQTQTGEGWDGGLGEFKAEGEGINVKQEEDPSVSCGKVFLTESSTNPVGKLEGFQLRSSVVLHVGTKPVFQRISRQRTSVLGNWCPSQQFWCSSWST